VASRNAPDRLVEVTGVREITKPPKRHAEQVRVRHQYEDAKALGLTVASSMQLLADEVIE
jgi:hypothetical protein